MKILLTTTSFQDTPGPHHQALRDSGFDIVRARGPLDEAAMLKLIDEHGGFDGLLNGDDEVTAEVIDAAVAGPTPLRVIAKYGIGLDSINVEHATAEGIPVLFTPGVNHTTVAEHAFGLMIGLAKHFKMHLRETAAGQWKRQTGVELAGKRIAVLGMGRIGEEVVKRAEAFDMTPIGLGLRWDRAMTERNDDAAHRMRDVLAEADVVSLHLPLRDATRGLIRGETIALMKEGVMIVNTARGGLVVEADVAEACRSGRIYGYAADVLGQEPPEPGHVFTGIDNILITPHIGSRTVESVGRQAMRATKNLVNFLNGDDDYIQANET